MVYHLPIRTFRSFAVLNGAIQLRFTLLHVSQRGSVRNLLHSDVQNPTSDLQTLQNVCSMHQVRQCPFAQSYMTSDALDALSVSALQRVWRVITRLDCERHLSHATRTVGQINQEKNYQESLKDPEDGTVAPGMYASFVYSSGLIIRVGSGIAGGEAPPQMGDQASAGDVELKEEREPVCIINGDTDYIV